MFVGGVAVGRAVVPSPAAGRRSYSMKVGFMQSICVVAGIAVAHSDASKAPCGPPRVVADPSEIVPLQLKWGVGVADLHRE